MGNRMIKSINLNTSLSDIQSSKLKQMLIKHVKPRQEIKIVPISNN